MTDHGLQVLLDGVRYYYQDGSHRHLVLDGINASLARAESIALLGASGAGKSTLLNLIAGIELPVAGHVRISGVELSSLSERERTLFRRRHIGFVYQFFNLIPHLTLLENIRLPRELNGEHPRKAADYGLQWLQRMGLRDRAGAFPEQVSGGEQQRVAIARALVHQPDLVLADEPTGSLDADTGADVLKLLLETVSHNGTTLLLVTHSESVASQAQRQLELADGKLISK